MPNLDQVRFTASSNYAAYFHDHFISNYISNICYNYNMIRMHLYKVSHGSYIIYANNSI